MERDLGLNLARAWRPRALGDVIGQRIAVSLLENSMRRGLIFPVYLFAGLRGTGKTSVGRIFSAALNCSALSRLDTKEGVVVPCYQCPSCRAMMGGVHPDFIEIDAASHTGVDQVRQIIEEASFLPVLGSRKVYLIDEAHMLSRAAFNAFLKMLEEPPKSVVFLLATTDPHKIIETVRSRCFQLFFDPVARTDMVAHLEKICLAESIGYEKEVLDLIALESDGSVRDAINMLERLRCSNERITRDSFFATFGCPDEQRFIGIFEIVAQGDVRQLFDKIIQLELERFEPSLIWERLIELVRAMMWAHEGKEFGRYAVHFQEVKRVANLFSFSQIVEFLDILFRFEGQFNKTSSRHALIERALYACAQRCEGESTAQTYSAERRHTEAVTSTEKARNEKIVDISSPREVVQTGTSSEKKATPPVTATGDLSTPWARFLALLGESGDPIILGVLRQGEFASCEDGVLRIRFPKKFVFYQELLINNRVSWQQHLEKIFGTGTLLVPDFSLEARENEVRKQPAGSTGLQPGVQRERTGSSTVQNIDVSDKEKWPIAQALLDGFPGKISISNGSAEGDKQ